MGTKELAKLLGRTGAFRTNEGLLVQVSILDAKIAWGAVRVQIVPVAGAGTAWVDKGRVKMDGTDASV